MGDSMMKNPTPISSDLKSFIPSPSRTRGTKLFVYGFAFSFMACTAFMAFNPSANASSPSFYSIFSSSSSTFKASMAPYHSQVSSLFSHFFPNPSTSVPNQTDGAGGSSKDAIFGAGSGFNGAMRNNLTQLGFGSKDRGKDVGENQTASEEASIDKGGVLDKNQVKNEALEAKNQTSSTITVSKQIGASIDKGGVLDKNQAKNEALEVKNQTLNTATVSKQSGASMEKKGTEIKNHTATIGASIDKSQVKNGTLEAKNQTVSSVAVSKGNGASIKNQTATSVTSSASSTAKKNSSIKPGSKENMRRKEKWIEDMIGCDLFHGHWVKDESYPLYPEGSCPHIDEPFDCYLNGRPDRSYQKFRWQPSGCNIPR